MYFIVFLYGIVWVLNITKYNSDFNCNEIKYCILELKMEFWHKKPFSIRFVHKSRKLSNFEPTFDYIMLRNLTLKPIFFPRDYSATRKALAATLYDIFLSSFPHTLTPNLWRPGVRFWSYVTFCTCTSDRKWLQNVILQIEFFHIVHINMLIFTLNGWNEFVFALLCFKKCLPQISPKKEKKKEKKKKREIHKKFIKQ